MVQQVRLPQLGESVETAAIVAWLVDTGDEVAVDQPIAEVSTDKVDTEIPSPLAGTVTRLLAAVDEEISVGAPILELDDAAGPASAATTGEQASPPDTGPSAGPGPGDAPRGGDVPGGDVPDGAGPDQGRLARLSPLVKRLLREHGLTPAAVPGTGRDGRITPDDVRAAARETTPDPGAATRSRMGRSPAPTAATRGAVRVEQLSRTRRLIAARMTESLHASAQLTSAVDADVTRIMHLRAAIAERSRARFGHSVSPLAFIARSVCRTLLRHPLLNASIDTDAGTVTYHGWVQLGIAVDAPAGLVVPVIRDAQDLTVLGLQHRIADLAERARDGKLSPDDVGGSTFTVTNTGSRGTTFDTPILAPPEVGILATPRIEKRPVVVTDRHGSDTIAIRHRTTLCLTYDHRLVDGADAGRFLTDLAADLDRDGWEQEVSELR